MGSASAQALQWEVVNVVTERKQRATQTDEGEREVWAGHGSQTPEFIQSAVDNHGAEER